MGLESLEGLLQDQLQDLFDAERQITKALPKVIKAVSTPTLKKALEKHLRETEEHVQRIEKVCAELEIEPKGKSCKAMRGILEEGDEVLKEKDQGDPSVVDAALIASCQKVEHYEIASYGTVIAIASQLGEDNVIKLLQRTLDEEKTADEILTEIAESEVNEEAETAVNE